MEVFHFVIQLGILSQHEDLEILIESGISLLSLHVCGNLDVHVHLLLKQNVGNRVDVLEVHEVLHLQFLLGLLDLEDQNYLLVRHLYHGLLPKL